LSHGRTDPIDLSVAQWRRERPDLDPAPLQVISRILMLYKQLEQSADGALEPFGLTLSQFDVLAALRRSGPPYQLSPTQLSRLVILTSGAMTNRIDRLELMGLVARTPSPDDRRALLVGLTPAGLQRIDAAAGARLDDARRNLAPLTAAEIDGLTSALRKLLVSFGDQAPASDALPNGSSSAAAAV
jgi:DNA-binding MarR family transcriptional regulator